MFFGEGKLIGGKYKDKYGADDLKPQPVVGRAQLPHQFICDTGKRQHNHPAPVENSPAGFRNGKRMTK